MSLQKKKRKGKRRKGKRTCFKHFQAANLIQRAGIRLTVATVTQIWIGYD